ncbi:COG3496 Uncharacterized conserved protein [Rhabdaerophilaceae bacterium]
MASLSPPISFADAEIFHARLRADGLRFRYRVIAMFIDLDRVDEKTDIPFFSQNRFSLFGFRAKDHGPRDGSSLRAYIDALHKNMGLKRPERVVLTCFPRIFGHAFNPISTYVSSDAAGLATSVIYEVRNTFGERHSYMFPVRVTADGMVAPHECDKLFYVSPFMDMPMRYRFLVSPVVSGEFSLKIIERDRQGVILSALMKAKSFNPTRSALLLRLLLSPLGGFKVLFGIHWQALRLWLKGHRIRVRPAPPGSLVSSQALGDFSRSKNNTPDASYG